MTPEQEQAVRRALAAAARAEDAERGSTAMPPEVADRLDDVLAELVQERRTRPGADHGSGRAGDADALRPTGGDELADRRRRRWPQVLVAAAAVCVIAATGGAVVTRGLAGSGGGSSAGSASSPEDRSAGGQAAPQQNDAPSSGTGAMAVGAPRMRSETLRHDVQALVDARSSRKALRTPAVPAAGCTTPAVRQGEQAIGVELDGRPATLVLGRRTGGSRAASVFSCEDAEVPVATTTVRAR